jgi:hypothetical protein
MKKKLLVLPLVIAALSGFAQNNNYPTAGNPTIYDYSPTIYLQRNINEGGYTQGVQTKLLDGTNNWFFGNLHDEQWIVAKGDYSNPKLTVLSSGNMGIGTANPTQRLSVSGNINLENPTGGNYLGFGVVGSSEYNTLGSMYSSAGLVLAHGLKPSNTVAGLVYAYQNMSRNAIVLGDNFSFGGIKFYTKSASQETVDAPFVADPAMQLTDGGNLLIGKTTQSNHTYKVDIAGKVRANEIVVNTTGADFVFESSYHLRPIAELEKFVKQNRHLPEIPAAKTMQQEGVGVSELQTKLLQKIEELTLYIIQQQKEIDELKKKVKL